MKTYHHCNLCSNLLCLSSLRKSPSTMWETGKFKEMWNWPKLYHNSQVKVVLCSDSVWLQINRKRVHVHCKVRLSFQINWIWIDLVAAQGRSRCSRSEHTAAQKAAPPVGSHQIRRTRSKDSSTGNPWTTNGDIALLVKSFIQDLGWPYSCAHILEQMCNDYLCNN